ncbi:calcium-activated potassium channel subunit beta-2 isoform X1 [Arapaima gigas]
MCGLWAWLSCGPTSKNRPGVRGAFSKRRSPCRSFQNAVRSTPASGRHSHPPAKMFLLTGTKGAPRTTDERRTIYQKIRDYDLLDKKKTVTALKAGEDRAILLGLSMILFSVMMYFVLGVTMVRSYSDSVWTEETSCTVLNSTVVAEINCTYSCGTDCRRASRYPCLQVFVSLNASGRVGRLSRDEETQEASAECFFVPECRWDQAAAQAMVANISECLTARQEVPCYHDPRGGQEVVLLTRLYGQEAVLRSLLWPSCTLLGGALIILLVKLTQYLSALCEQISKVKR